MPLWRLMIIYLDYFIYCQCETDFRSDEWTSILVWRKLKLSPFWTYWRAHRASKEQPFCYDYFLYQVFQSLCFRMNLVENSHDFSQLKFYSCRWCLMATCLAIYLRNSSMSSSASILSVLVSLDLCCFKTLWNLSSKLLIFPALHKPSSFQ